MQYIDYRRYTMYDIGILEKRIQALEDYILRTQNQYNVENLSIFGSDGTEQYKVGYIADNFADHSYGEINNVGYLASIDVLSNELRPSFKLSTINLEKSSGTISELNNKYVLPSTNRTIISQLVGTSTLYVNENPVQSFVGDLSISPNINNYYNNTNQQKANFDDDSTYIEEINAILANSDNYLEYNEVLLGWLGTGVK
jgi:hypothetical protein